MMPARSAVAAGISSGGVDHPRSTEREGVPAVSPILFRWFTWYSRRYLRYHFHSLRVSRAGLPPRNCELPLVVFSNHASWWDPLLWLALKTEFFPSQSAFSPIDAKALARYKLLSRVGFFGVEQKTGRGAIQFLRIAEKILRQPGHILALTPQGRFADARERPVRFETGLGHLAARVERATFLPMASEFVYWEERLPEILVRFGEPIKVDAASKMDAEGWTALFEQRLETVQDALGTESQRRSPSQFQTIRHGRAGQGGVYDWYRAAKAKLRREKFVREHGAK